MTQHRILIVEDDAELVNSLKRNLEAKGFEVESANDGESGLKLALSRPYSVIILDVNLPIMDGLDVCKRIREQNSEVAILILSCLGEEIDKVVGLEVGADDHVTKPFRMTELVARLRALIRRAQKGKQVPAPPATGGVVRLDELSIDLENRHVRMEDTSIELTPLEFRLLALLASNPGRTFTREQILETVWETNHFGYEHSVTNTAKRLRGKIDKGANPPKFIQTVRGVGYRLGPPPLR